MNSHSKRRLLTSAAVALGLSGLGSSLTAQAQGQDSNEDTRRLATVVVSATKRDQSLQDVPVAVTALTGDALNDAGVGSVEGLATVVPSVTFSQSSNDLNNSVRIRGIGTSVFSSAIEPSVSIVIDDVVMARQGQGFQDLVDIERVEVLRGPQSTLFGKNASAGVISVTTKAPSDTLSGAVDLLYAEGEEYGIRGTISAPLSEKVGFRLTGFAKDFDGHIENEFDGGKLNGFDNWGVRGKLAVEASDNFNLTFIADYRDSNQDCCVFTVRDTSGALNAAQGGAVEALLLPVVASPDNRSVNVNAPSFNNSEQMGVSAKAEYEFGDGYEFTSISAWREWDFMNNLDVDSTSLEEPLPGIITFDLNSGNTGLEQFSQEFRLTSPDSERFDYVIGAYAFLLDLDREFQRRLEIAIPRPTGLLRINQSGQFAGTVETLNLAAFVSANWHVDDQTTVLGGLRVVSETLDYTVLRDPANVVVTGDRPLGGGAGQPADIDGSTSDTALVGDIGLQRFFSPNVQGYLKYSRGYKGRGFNVALSGQQDSEPVEAETSNAFEAGIKSSLADGRVILNAALFHTVYDNFQAQQRVPGEIAAVLANVGSVKTAGVEVELTARLTELLTIQGGLSYTDATIDEFQFGPCSPGQTVAEGCVGGNQDLAGGDLPNAPDWRLTASASQDVPLSAMPFDGFINTNIVWQDDVVFALDQNPATIQDAYALVNLSVGIRDKEGRYKASVFANNLFDESFAASIFNHPVFSGVVAQYIPRNAERYVGARLAVNF